MNTMKKFWLASIATVTNCVVALAAPTGGMMEGASTRQYSEYLASGDETPLQIVGNVIEFVLMMMGALAVGMIIYAGIKIVSTGTEEGMTEWKNMVKYAVIGLCVVIVAYTIVNWVTGGTSFLYGGVWGDTSLQ